MSAQDSTQTKTTRVALTSKIARTAKPAAKKPAAKATKPAATPKTLVCKCADHEGNARQPIDNFSLDAKWAKTNFGRNIWCKSCQKAYRAAKKATSVKNDVQPIAAPRGRRTATIPTPPVAEAAVVAAIANVNAAIEAAA